FFSKRKKTRRVGSIQITINQFFLRTAEFAEFGIVLFNNFVALRSRRLCGESSESLRRRRKFPWIAAQRIFPSKSAGGVAMVKGRSLAAGVATARLGDRAVLANL
ncbi:MAG: hypothetical protein ABIP88_06875, partial [Candidatus Binatia bacterium]